MTNPAQDLPVIPGYRLRKLLGRGGMAAVFLADRDDGGERVAVKVMRAPPGEDNDWTTRFIREGSILKKFNHPNIVRVFDVGESNGDHYIVMEHLDHGDLTRWIKEGLQPADALRLMRSLALALDYAHKQGYIHRDMKPDNVLFRADGTPVLTDFGVARPRHTDSRLTQVGMVVGTPRYMSPEQHKGLAVDPRTDIYALGIVFYEMLTREVPYDGNDSMSIGIKHLTEPVPRLPARFVRYQRLLDGLLAKDPKERFSQCETLVKAIDMLLAQPEPQAKKALAASTALQRGLAVQETETKTGFFSKACDISLSVGAEDYQSLQQHCGKASDVLLEWHRDVGKKARHISIDFYVHPWILALTRDLARRLQDADDLTFLSARRAKIRIHDLDGVLEQEFTFGEEVPGK
jgi:serine/threonine protein kinase